MNGSSILLAVIISAVGLGIAIISTIRAYVEIKKATEEKISKRKKEISMFIGKPQSLEFTKYKY